jgi:hypothetical protein
MSNIAMLVGFDHIKSVAYSHEENSIVERANKEIVRHLRNILLEYSAYGQWSSVIPFVQRIMNAKRHSSLGVSPAQLIFGTTATLDQGILLPSEEVAVNSSGVLTKVSDYMKRMINQQSIILQIASRHLDEVLDRRATLNERRHASDNVDSSGSDNHVQEYTVDSFVLLAWPSSNGSSGPPNKLKHNLRGPYKVVSVTDNHLVVQSLVNFREYNYHKSRFIPFLYDPAVTDPYAVAYKDLEYYEVERVVDIKGPLNKNQTAFLRKKIEVLVKWSHLDEPQWEPYENMRDTEKFIEFIKEKYAPRSKEYKLIPNKFIRNGEVVLG